MDKVGEIAEQANNGGGWFGYVMFAVICFHLYKQIKEKGILDKLEAKIDELKAKIDK